jgi:hypothetical protein
MAVFAGRASLSAGLLRDELVALGFQRVIV